MAKKKGLKKKIYKLKNEVLKKKIRKLKNEVKDLKGQMCILEAEFISEQELVKEKKAEINQLKGVTTVDAVTSKSERQAINNARNTAALLGELEKALMGFGSLVEDIPSPLTSKYADAYTLLEKSVQMAESLMSENYNEDYM